jgi:hypothetical protein
VGLTLPGIIDDPGSFSGKIYSPNPHLGPHPSSLISFAILFKEQANTFSAPEKSTIASFDYNASNLFGAVTNLYPV